MTEKLLDAYLADLNAIGVSGYYNGYTWQYTVHFNSAAWPFVQGDSAESSAAALESAARKARAEMTR